MKLRENLVPCTGRRIANEWQVSTLLSRSFSPPATAGLGHEHQFSLPRLSGCCGFGQRTFPGTRGNGEVAPMNEPACGRGAGVAVGVISER
jgi:hypothetical protein